MGPLDQLQLSPLAMQTLKAALASANQNPQSQNPVTTAAGAALRNSPTTAQQSQGMVNAAQGDSSFTPAAPPKPAAPPGPMPDPNDPDNQLGSANAAVQMTWQQYQDSLKKAQGDTGTLVPPASYNPPTYEPPPPKTMLGLALAALFSRWASPALAQTAQAETDKSQTDYERKRQAAQDQYTAQEQGVQEQNAAVTARLGREDQQVDYAERAYTAALKNQGDVYKLRQVEIDHAQRRNDLLAHWQDQFSAATQKQERAFANAVSMQTMRDDAAMARLNVQMPLRIAAMKSRVILAVAQMGLREKLAQMSTVSADERANLSANIRKMTGDLSQIDTKIRADSTILNSLTTTSAQKQAAASDQASLFTQTQSILDQNKDLGIDTNDVEASFDQLGTAYSQEVGAEMAGVPYNPFLNPSPSDTSGGGATINQYFTGVGDMNQGTTTRTGGVPPPAPHTEKQYYGHPLSWYRTVLDSITDPAKRKQMFELPPPKGLAPEVRAALEAAGYKP